MDHEHFEYRTGGAAPKKNRSGLLAFLLILLIFFGGIVSALGLMDIHLTDSAKKDPKRPLLTFSQTDPADTTNPSQSETADRSVKLSGMICRELTPQYQQMYGLPAGLYIAQVTKNSPAARLGILPGDVLTGFNGVDISQLEALESLIRKQPNGTPVEIVAYRGGEYFRLTLTFNQ